jgi:hypothetical protein
MLTLTYAHPASSTARPAPRQAPVRNVSTLFTSTILFSHATPAHQTVLHATSSLPQSVTRAKVDTF